MADTLPITHGDAATHGADIFTAPSLNRPTATGVGNPTGYSGTSVGGLPVPSPYTGTLKATKPPSLPSLNPDRGKVGTIKAKAGKVRGKGKGLLKKTGAPLGPAPRSFS